MTKFLWMHFLTKIAPIDLIQFMYVWHCKQLGIHYEDAYDMTCKEFLTRVDKKWN